MPVTDEAHALQIVEQVAPIFERFGVEMETLHHTRSTSSEWKLNADVTW